MHWRKPDFTKIALCAIRACFTIDQVNLRGTKNESNK